MAVPVSYKAVRGYNWQVVASSKLSGKVLCGRPEGLTYIAQGPLQTLPIYQFANHQLLALSFTPRFKIRILFLAQGSS